MFTIRQNKVSAQRTAPASTIAHAGLSPESLIVRTQRPNVLITGSNATTEVFVATLRPYLQNPVCDWATETALPTPCETATLLISDVATLSLEQQQALMGWLDRAAAGDTQVVSTTALELFPLVERGTFLEALYYRLNTVRLDAPTHIS
jgi:hypothetical protein